MLAAGIGVGGAVLAASAGAAMAESAIAKSTVDVAAAGISLGGEVLSSAAELLKSANSNTLNDSLEL